MYSQVSSSVVKNEFKLGKRKRSLEDNSEVSNRYYTNGFNNIHPKPPTSAILNQAVVITNSPYASSQLVSLSNQSTPTSSTATNSSPTSGGTAQSASSEDLFSFFSPNSFAPPGRAQTLSDEALQGIVDETFATSPKGP